MPCGRTTSGVCEKALAIVDANPSLLIDMEKIRSKVYGLKRDDFVIANVSPLFSVICESVVERTEKLAETLPSDQAADLEAVMWEILRSSSLDRESWADCICRNDHNFVTALRERLDYLRNVLLDRWKKIAGVEKSSVKA